MKKTLNNIRQIKLLFIIGVMVISYECVINSQDCHHYSYNSEKIHQETEKQSEELLCPSQISSEKANVNLSEFRRYQTFDEFKMRGVGKPIQEPFVYVKSEKDKITVVTSDDTTYVMTYHHIKDGLWYMHMDFDLWKKNQYRVKDSKENSARSYDRICGNDSIVELEWDYEGISTSVTILLKSPTGCVRSHCLHPSHYEEIEDSFKRLQRLIELFVKDDDSLKNILNKKLGREEYFLQETDDEYWYIGKKYKLCFKKNSLGFFGIQPGFDKFDRNLSSQDYFP